MVKPIPDGYEAVTPYLIVDGAAAALEFYKGAFGAEEVHRIETGDGRIGHAEIRIGKGMVMLADPFPEIGAAAPEAGAAVPVSLTFYCEDVDALVVRALRLGAQLRGEIEDKFYGDRMASLLDPFGHTWHVATHIEDVAPDELARRAKAAIGG